MRSGWSIGSSPVHELGNPRNTTKEEVFIFLYPLPLYIPFAVAAKSLQSCPTLCNPIDGSPPGSPVHGILQARTLEWVAISFSNAWKWKLKVKSLSRVGPTLSDPMGCSPPGSFLHGMVQARVLEGGAIAFSVIYPLPLIKMIIFVSGVLLKELPFIHILFTNSYTNPEILPCLKRDKPGWDTEETCPYYKFSSGTSPYRKN